MTPHPHKDILNAIADGKEIQASGHTGKWVDVASADVLNKIAKGIHLVYRIKPETILINGFWCPAPVTEKDSQGFALDIQCNWTGKYRERLWFQSEADAKTVFDTLILPFKEAGK